MSTNKKISEIEKIIISPHQEVQVVTYNFTTKKMKSMPISDFQTAFGLGDAQFFVGEHNQQIVSEKFSVFGDARIWGSIVSPSGTVGIGTSPIGSGFTLGSDLFTDHIYDAGVPNSSEIDLTSENIKLLTNGVEGMTISGDSINFNPEKSPTAYIKGHTPNSTASLNNTSFFFDFDNNFFGLGTDEPRANVDVYGGRVILGGSYGGTLNPNPLMGGFSALGGNAFGDQAIAFQSSAASGFRSFAVNNSTALGSYSFSQGSGTTSFGIASAAFNFQTVASGDYSMAIGDRTLALGIHSFAQGVLTEANGVGSFAGGSSSLANGLVSLAQGQNCIADADCSVSLGYYSEALGDYSQANGANCKAISDYSFAGGLGSVASGDYAYANGRECLSSGESAYSEGIRSKSLASASMALGIEALATQPAEHNRSMTINNSGARTDISKYFLYQSQSGYNVGEKYEMKLGNSNENIMLGTNGMYNFEALINGRGSILETQKEWGNSVSWGYKLKGQLAVREISGVVETSFSGAPYIYYTPMSPIYGGTNIPSGLNTVQEPYIITDDTVVMSPSQFNQVKGFAPYVEFDKATGELLFGVVRTHEITYAEFGEARIGNVDGFDDYRIDPSLLVVGKNLSADPLNFNDISAVFSKDSAYFLSTYGYDLDTSTYVVRDSLNADVGAVSITYSGVGSLGETDVPNLTTGFGVGFDNLLIDVPEMDANLKWHTVADVNRIIL